MAVNPIKLYEVFFDQTKMQKTLIHQIFNAIENRNTEEIKQIFENATNSQLQSALQEQERTLRNLNCISFAAHKDNKEAINLIVDKAKELKILRTILGQMDSSGWNFFHHATLMTDNAETYKKVKKLSKFKTNGSIDSYYCESPSFLRKCLSKEPKYFVAKTFFVRSGPPEKREEVRLTFDELMAQYGDQFTIKPKTFRLIPYGSAEFFSRMWKSCEGSKRDPNILEKLDRLLKTIKDDNNDNGLALTPVTHDDKGQKITLQIGMGIETRKAYETGQLVTPYGGKFRYKPEGDLSLYCYEVNKKVSLEGNKHRSYGSSTMHSYPNTYWRDVWTKLGPITCLKAIEDIPEGTLVAIDYGEVYFESEDYDPIELRPSAVEKYIPNDVQIDPKNFNTLAENIRMSYMKVYGPNAQSDIDEDI